MPELDNKLKAVKDLLATFKFERMAYLILSVVTTVTIIGVAVWLVISKPEKYEYFFSLFAPAGVLTYSMGRILKMWTQALNFLGGGNPTK